uniref:C2H2-type domain-containing protein n=1 Tax=Moniliophthora roreri TaxID=221103 RepID=A0A0W0EZZ3_MONRR
MELFQPIINPLYPSGRNDTACDWDSQTSSGISISVHSDTLEEDHVREISPSSVDHSPFPDTPPTSAGLPQSPLPFWMDNGTSDTCCEVLRSDLGVLLYDMLGNSSLLEDYKYPYLDMFLTDGDLGDPPHLGQPSDSIYHSCAGLSPWNEGPLSGSGMAESVDPFPARRGDSARQITLKQEEVDLPSSYQCDKPTSSLTDPKAVFPKHEDEAPLYPQCSAQYCAPTINFHHSPQHCAFQESIGGNGDVIRPVGSDALLHASMRRRERNPSYFCPYQGCAASFTAKHNLKNHLNSHQGIRPFTCKGCHRSFGTKHVLKRHKNTCEYYRRLRGTSSHGGAN